ncbi:MAG: ABC transporter ATP-binding protein [Desulfovibrio sp.]|jgi:branched-chain amino acid transport system ATP-binding protein|nr:ABC transporter ATP-binding protein [Desulfovibrio sp.]
MHLLEARNISIRFGGLLAVSDANFHVDENEIVSIIGPNGAGKTTIFNILTGLYRCNSGELYFRGNQYQDIRSPQEIMKMGISRTFQNIRLFPNMRVIENVLMGMHTNTKYTMLQALLRTGKFRQQEALQIERSVAILKAIGLASRMHEPARNLPYGEQRKLEIARAIATGAKCLLLDEPAAGMNSSETEELLKFLMLLKENGCTILLIEHDMKFVMNISDRIYVFDHGDQIADGTPSAIASNPKVIRAYLGGDENSADN